MDARQNKGEDEEDANQIAQKWKEKTEIQIHANINIEKTERLFANFVLKKTIGRGSNRRLFRINSMHT